MLFDQYYENVLGLLGRIKSTQMSAMKAAGHIIANTIQDGGLIHVFGCGHSHMISEELFFRAGGLVNINAIFDTSVMLHEGAVKGSRIEREAFSAPLVLDRYQIGKSDCMLIASNSGINGYPIEMALVAKNKGIPVIGITSFAYRMEKVKHLSGQHFSDACTLAIDNCVPHGDASVQVTADGRKSGPLSSIALFFIAQSVVLMACDELKLSGKEPKIFVSGNLPNGDSMNQEYIQEKLGVIKHL